MPGVEGADGDEQRKGQERGGEDAQQSFHWRA
jgi:hypothetical protein